MKITTTGRKCTLRPAFVERTETKLSKINKFFDSAASADVTVSNERNKQRVEITIRCNGLLFRAEEAAEDPNEAVDKLVDVLLRQIRRNKTRLEKRLRQGAFERSVDDEISTFVPDGPEEGEYNLVRRKRFPIKPMTRDEAILQMNLLGHSFFAFRDEDADGAFAVVYCRNDGDYGLIEDEA